MSPGFGGASLLGTPQNLPPAMLGGGGSGQRGPGNIPSLLDINTKKPQGKRGFSGPRDQGGFKKQRMTSQKVFLTLNHILNICYHMYKRLQWICREIF